MASKRKLRNMTKALILTLMTAGAHENSGGGGDKPIPSEKNSFSKKEVSVSEKKIPSKQTVTMYVNTAKVPKSFRNPQGISRHPGDKYGDECDTWEATETDTEKEA